MLRAPPSKCPALQTRGPSLPFPPPLTPTLPPSTRSGAPTTNRTLTHRSALLSPASPVFSANANSSVLQALIPSQQQGTYYTQPLYAAPPHVIHHTTVVQPNGMPAAMYAPHIPPTRHNGVAMGMVAGTTMAMSAGEHRWLPPSFKPRVLKQDV